MTIKTTTHMWDCDCPTHYQHAQGAMCSVCEATQEDSPDARIAELPDSTMGCFLFTIKNYAGEQEWVDQWLTQAADLEHADEIATEQARNNWDDTPDANEYGVYSFFCGAVACEVEGVREIPRDHYAVLRQYISVVSE